jgi:deoxycytidylate deaminase
MARNITDSELVIGIIATVGTETKETIKYIGDQLEFFRYTTEEIVVSKCIISQFEATPPNFETEYNRISHYMDMGNKIRETSDDMSILAKGVARQIYVDRPLDEYGKRQPRKRYAYIINSLKNPAEVDFLRQTYGDAFHLIGITSTRERRLKYLVERKGLSTADAKELLKRDEDEESKQGQHTRDAFQHADYFINVTEDADHTYNSVARLIDLLFGNPFISPNFDEYAMFMAYATSMRSADLSRQVGAVVSKEQEILSMGVNDCPRVGGGLYWPVLAEHGKYEDEPEGRDYMLGYDSNKIEQEKIIKAVLTALNEDVSEENISKVKHAGIGDLTEYGRVVHGEMEALMSCARNNISCRGATMYVTTFPCHNCAKHIIAAGVKRVVYIEPYPKSKAFLFYHAEISSKPSDEKRVIFEPFVGVGPQRFVDLFALSSTKWYARKRKTSDGKKVDWKRESAELRNPASLFNYIDEEEQALMVFEDEAVAFKKED